MDNAIVLAAHVPSAAANPRWLLFQQHLRAHVTHVVVVVVVGGEQSNDQRTGNRGNNMMWQLNLQIQKNLRQKLRHCHLCLCLCMQGAGFSTSRTASTADRVTICSAQRVQSKRGTRFNNTLKTPSHYTVIWFAPDS